MSPQVLPHSRCHTTLLPSGILFLHVWAFFKNASPSCPAVRSKDKEEELSTVGGRKGEKGSTHPRAPNLNVGWGVENLKKRSLNIELGGAGGLWLCFSPFCPSTVPYPWTSVSPPISKAALRTLTCLGPLQAPTHEHFLRTCPFTIDGSCVFLLFSCDPSTPRLAV